MHFQNESLVEFWRCYTARRFLYHIDTPLQKLGYCLYVALTVSPDAI